MNKDKISELLVMQIPKLRRYARALTRNTDSADDLVQDCLERAWRKTHLWRPDSDLRAWLFTLMHNVYVNGLRSKKLSMEPDNQRELQDPHPLQHEGPLRLRDLEAGLATLSADQREVLLLVCLEGMTYAQVGDVLGIPIGTVMSRLHRGRERLRRWMDGEHAPALRRIK